MGFILILCLSSPTCFNSPAFRHQCRKVGGAGLVYVLQTYVWTVKRQLPCNQISLEQYLGYNPIWHAVKYPSLRNRRWWRSVDMLAQQRTSVFVSRSNHLMATIGQHLRKWNMLSLHSCLGSRVQDVDHCFQQESSFSLTSDPVGR